MTVKLLCEFFLLISMAFSLFFLGEGDAVKTPSFARKITKCTNVLYTIFPQNDFSASTTSSSDMNCLSRGQGDYVH